jgi:hypothetical protein
MRERSFAFESVRIVARGDEQDRGGVHADAVELEQARCRAPHKRVEFLVQAFGVGFEREHPPPEGGDREFRRIQHGVAARRGSERRRSARQMITGHMPQPFTEFVGGGEAEMTDLVQVLDAHVATGAAHDQQRADRLHIAISGLRDARRPSRQRGAGRFDRVDLIGLAALAAHLTVRAIHLDHHQPPTAQMTSQPRAIGARAFHPDPINRTEPGQPTV